MLPHVILKKFLEDAETPPYKGFASAGFRWKPLIDPSVREYFNVRENGGVQVLSCLPHTGAAEFLRPNDVILSWDGHRIDNMGFYDDPDYSRLLFSHLIRGRRKPGDTVPVRLVRDRNEITVNLTLNHWSNNRMLIPENELGAKEEYLIEGGMIIRQLSGNYLRAHGAGRRRCPGEADRWTAELPGLWERLQRLYECPSPGRYLR